MRTTWTTLIHGEEKSGKSNLANTAPAPRLIADAEGRAQFLPGRKIYWHVAEGDPPPRHDGTWDTCIAPVYDFQTGNLIYRWLRDGSTHDFKSFALDSLMELQKRCVDKIVPDARALQQQEWGELFRLVEKQVRMFRDLRYVTNNSLETFVFIAGSRHDDNRGWAPYLQGQLEKQVGYYFDTIGYLFKQPQPDGSLTRALLIDKQPGFVAGDGTGMLVRHYGPIVNLVPEEDQHLSNFMDVIRAEGGNTA